MSDDSAPDPDFAVKLFGQLDTLEERYARFMRRATVALIILTCAIGWQLFAALPRKTDEIQQSRADVIRQFCEDEKLLLSIVPPGFPLPAAPADSALNPGRDCDQFAERFVRP